MEDKLDCLVGQIVEIDNKYYQCLLGHHCSNCDIIDSRICNSICCAPRERKDATDVIFEKLIKVGEPQQKCGGIFQVYKYFANPAIIKYTNGAVSTINNSDYIIAFKTDKTEINMETKNLKPFNLEAAKAGKPVCTRDGRQARIICFDRKFTDDKHYCPIVALIKDGENEYVYFYADNGLISKHEENGLDLMMIPEKKEGWIRVKKDVNLYATKEEADRKMIGNTDYVSAKVEWEE